MKKLLYCLPLLFLCFALSSCKKGCKHTFGEFVVDKQATCTENGSKSQYCTKCSAQANVTIIEKLGHSTNDATFLEDSICTRCNQVCEYSTVSQEINKVLSDGLATSPTLPTEIEGASLTWKSHDKTVMMDDGTIVYGEENRLGMMEATITVDGTTCVKTYYFRTGKMEVNINPHQYAWAQFYSSKLTKPAGKNIMLLKQDYNGCKVIYESMNEDILTSDGKITQSIKDQDVVMNVYIVRDGFAVLNRINVTIVKYDASQRFELAIPRVHELVEEYKTGKIKDLPVFLDEYEVELYWKSNVPELIVFENETLAPFEKTDLILSCLLKYGKTTNKLSFEIKDFVGSLTKEEYLQKFLNHFSEIKLLGSKNYLEEVNNELYLDYQVRINSGGVLNLFQPKPIDINREYIIDENRNDFVAKFFGAGKYGVYKPVVTQEVLNNRLYEGYQMPNDKNVLWIVVHESAMTIDGQNAEYLAKMQYRYAFESGGRAASWNYQIDAYSAYQSFEDDIICWHASDGTDSVGTGNNNGIGIEMCVNQDGNYEGTLANNAKLVASLLLKYNLNLENVKRHFDMDPKQKECPSYLIRTNRYDEFTEMIRMEYILQKYFGKGTMTYDLSTSEYSNTEAVLKNLFETGANGLYYNLPVNEKKEINFKVTAVVDGKTYVASSVITLLPDTQGAK